MSRLPRREHRRQKAPGFTLIEVVVTLSIAVILVSLAAPGFQQMIANNRAAALSNEIVRALNLARSEAVTRGVRVTVCKSDKVDTDTPECNTSASWQNGWVIFTDLSGNGEVDTSDTVLRVGQPMILNGSIDAGSKIENYISFLPDGQPRVGAMVGNATLTICVDSVQRRIKINTMGRIKIEKGDC